MLFIARLEYPQRRASFVLPAPDEKSAWLAAHEIARAWYGGVPDNVKLEIQPNGFRHLSGRMASS